MNHQQIFYKAIIQGNLEFGNEKSYSKIQTLYTQRMETLYKKDVIFKNPEALFIPESYRLQLGRHICNTSEKSWKNTISLLEYCAQFSFSGTINAWLTDNGKILQHFAIEPMGEKSMVTLYQEGKKLSEQIGSEEEAIKLFTEAIEKYDRHSQAYEKRGYMNYHLKNYDDAIYDFKKSIHIDDMNASAYYGLGRAYAIKNQWNEAIQNMEETCKHSVALQPLYWTARRFKAQCHMELNDYERASAEYKLFTTRQYGKTDPNYKHLPMAWFNYGKCLFAIGRLDDALEAFDQSLSFQEDPNGGVPKATLLTHRGIARKAAGLPDYIVDLRRASELGSETAARILAETV
ncbi:MAG: tetratricopeptide repeat protein [Saprospiraceae bacterium]|nr:tetratricopeptide repeat protein [Saprospiraceae bacterium]MBK7796573.1 tetratricopeptide repeat protein [Saprospiraceae bacterium]MBK9378819.1 tetratricopeptide repeat protein [Saprospiraceae bacterium]MBL0260037.1 tetratricopeptide repeat protein [Saprospiraceae bacterium]